VTNKTECNNALFYRNSFLGERKKIQRYLSSQSKYSQTENRKIITVKTNRFLDPFLCQSKPVKSLTLDFFNKYFNINCHLCPDLPSVGFRIRFGLRFRTAFNSLMHYTCLAYFVVLNLTTLILCEAYIMLAAFIHKTSSFVIFFICLGSKYSYNLL
jgi:hypothetical protein